MNLPAGQQPNNEDQKWKNPQDPEASSDNRDNEQLKRQHEEAKRRKDNLTETDHIDREIKRSE